jgi:hypothetical protein
MNAKMQQLPKTEEETLFGLDTRYQGNPQLSKITAQDFHQRLILDSG